MKKCQTIPSCLVLMACLGMLPHAGWATQPVNNPHVKRSLDVSLHQNGLLIGQLVTPQGKSKPGAQIRIFRQGKELIRTRTDKMGRFAIKGLQAGNYKIATAKLAVPVRAWPKATAPPQVAVGALLVEGTIIRAQGSAEPIPIPTPDAIPAEPVVSPSYASGSYSGAYAGGAAGGSQGLLGLGMFSGGGVLGASPLVIGAGVAAAVAVPVALDDDESGSGGSGGGGAGEPAS